MSAALHLADIKTEADAGRGGFLHHHSDSHSEGKQATHESSRKFIHQQVHMKTPVRGKAPSWSPESRKWL